MERDNVSGTTLQTRLLRSSVPWDKRVFDEPLFWLLRANAALLPDGKTLPDVRALDALLSTSAGVRFEAADPVGTPRRKRAPYDTSITMRGVVPTREGSWHDLMNALVWAVFPRSKRALHTLQARFVAEERAAGSGHRSAAHDALAILDEGGVIVCGDAVYTDEVSIRLALDQGRARALAFGHAIYESEAIGAPRPVVRARSLVVPAYDDDAGLVRAADESLCTLIESGHFAATPRELPRIALDCVFGAASMCGMQTSVR
jgi:hypothetical protein